MIKAIIKIDNCGIRTHARRLVPETSALDHSAKLPFTSLTKIIALIYYSLCLQKEIKYKNVIAPSENRTRVFSATTRCPNHWTMRAESW